MQYIEPKSIAEAVQCLAIDDARPLAGGATLVAMLNEGLLAPARLVSLQRIAGLEDIRVNAEGGIHLGAMCRHADVASSSVFTAGLELVREAASQIAHPTIRNMGTIGGSIAHADPNADYPCALLACGATVCIVGPDGERKQPIDGFFVDYMLTTLQPGELIVGVELAAPKRLETSAYLKFSRVDGDYATVSVGVRAEWDVNGRCRALRVAVGSCHVTPIRSVQAEEWLIAGELAPDAVDKASQLLVEAADPVDDFRGSADYRRMLIPGLVHRALHLVKEKCEHHFAI